MSTPSIPSVPRIPRIPRIAGRAWPTPRWRNAAGIAAVLLLTVIGCYVEANPAHFYGGLHLTGHPPLAAYLLVALPALALAWRDRAPVAVFAVTIAAAVAWAALGQIDGAALVPVMVALFWVALTCSRQVTLAAGWPGRPPSSWPRARSARSAGSAAPARPCGRSCWPRARRRLRRGAPQVAGRRAGPRRPGRADAGGGDPPAGRRRADADRARAARCRRPLDGDDQRAGHRRGRAAGEDPAGAADAIQAIRGASKSGLRELRAILRCRATPARRRPGCDAQPARHPDARRRDHRRGLARHRAGRRPGGAAAAAGRAGRLPHRAGIADQRRAPRPRRVRDRDRGPGRRRADNRDH